MSTALVRSPLARSVVVAAVAAQVAVLTLLSGGYGYHRDELYFRMLPPAWAYVDQPGLVPFVVRLFASVVDEPWAIRVPATACAAVSVYVVTLLTREVGGDRAAQALSAWGYAFGVMPLMFGHAAVTPAFDLPLWPAIVLFAVRALLRREPRWWLAVGITIGVATYVKLLVVVLVVALVVGLLTLGPRGSSRNPWFWAGVAVAGALAAPNLAYQVRHDLPQLAVGAGLAQANGVAVRWGMWPFLLVLLGPAQAYVWFVGWRELWRRPRWRPIRGLVVALPVLLALVCVMGSQLYYPLGLVAALYAIGCVPVAERRTHLPLMPGRAAGTARWVCGWVGVNAVIAAVVALPVLPVSWLRIVPVGVVNPLVAESIGWSEQVRGIAAIRDRLPVVERPRVVVLTATYGQAGAVARYGPALGLDAVFSGHNALADLGPPPPERSVAIVVGPIDVALFRTCSAVGTSAPPAVLGAGPPTPLQVCREPVGGWSTIWPRLHHLG